MTLEHRKLRRSIPILNDLDSYLYADIKRVFVFGRESDCAFLITKNDRVYAYGKNNCGCLGLATDEPVKEPQQVTTLSGRKIIEFSAGRDHVLSLTKNGQIYACGSNEYGQLALKSSTNIPLLIESLRKDRIIAISCGAFHSLALTSRGIILGWGFNFWGQLGIGNNLNQFQPMFLLHLNRENIVEIACGQHHSVALSRKGDLFTWGHNAFGQLGIGEKINYKNIPTKAINGREFPIKQVTCGQNHVLAVSLDGKLLGFGSNYYGQLGTGSRRNELSPVHICPDEKIKDILSSPFSNTSLARTKKKRNSLVFGKVGDHWLLTPIQTQITDSNDYYDNNINNNDNDNSSVLDQLDGKLASNRNSYLSSSSSSYDINNNNINNIKESRNLKMSKNRQSKQQNCHEIFANINQSTAHTTKVVKSKVNIFWQVVYLMKNKFTPRNFHQNHREKQQQQEQEQEQEQIQVQQMKIHRRNQPVALRYSPIRLNY